MINIKLDHPTDPRYLLVPDGLLPERISPEEAFDGKYGKLMLVPAAMKMITYEQPGGPGTDWVKP